jgi:tetratricopeptide (TPR) repeat protein
MNVRGRPARDLTPKLLFIGFLLLLVNSGYLIASGQPTLVYLANVLLHVVVGAMLMLPFPWYTRGLLRLCRTTRGPMRAVFAQAGVMAMAGGMAAGVALLILGNLTPNRWLLQLHIGLVAAAVTLLAAAFCPYPRRWNAEPGLKRVWVLAMGAVALACILPATQLALQANSPDPRAKTNRALPPYSQDQEGMFGKDGPFHPAGLETTTRGRIPSAFFMTSRRCADCHADIFRQWSESAHRFSSFNNQWYRKSIEYMQEVIGTRPSRWCAGCHDVALLLNGMMDTPIQEIVHTPEAQVGLACTACHAITQVKDTMGNGDYVVEYPALHDLMASDSKLLNALHDFLVMVDPEPHRKSFLKPFHRGADSAEFCSVCHKVHLDVHVNNYRWFRGFNEYDAWQASGASGFGARSFYYPPRPMVCTDCHMPLVPSHDLGNVNGFVHSHRFPAANTALPTANRHAEQLRTTVQFLQNNVVTLDIFALSLDGTAPLSSRDPHGQAEAPQVATTFVVGEEHEAGVGRRVGSAAPARQVIAPLDAVQASVRRGSSVLIDVVARTRNIGHFFPGGTIDAFDVWLELKAEDERGRVIFWSGDVEDDGKGPVDQGAHFFRAFLVDQHGNEINKRNAWAARGVVYAKAIPPGAADTVHYRLHIPPDVGDTISLTARLNYRKFSRWNTQFAFAGVRDPTQQSFGLSPHYDDGRWVFNGDTSTVSGEVKAIPDLPIVVMATAQATLRVIDRDAALPEMRVSLEPKHRERWNDYGIGLLLQGDLRGAEAAFQQVTQINPGYADGWVNIARAQLQEGNVEGAQEVLKRALELDPDLPKTHFFLALALKAEGSYEEALAHLRRAAANYPKDRVVRNQMGRVLFLQGRFEEAIDELKHVLTIDPEDLQAHYNLMLSYRGVGNLDMAQTHETLYRRFKADEAAQVTAAIGRRRHPAADNEGQAVHEHHSIPLPGMGSAAQKDVGYSGN